MCINLLNGEIITQINKKVNDVLGRYVEDFSSFSLDTFTENKAQFYTDFGNQFIVTKDIKIEMTPEIKKSEMDRCLDKDMPWALRELIQRNGPEGFFQNKIISPLKIDGVDVPKGMKLSKAFKLFISNEVQLERSQTAYSKYLNPVLAGKLSLSCHPLDYLSLSMNTHGWSSCQSLTGDYGAGTLSLMNDRVTLVGYLHNGQEYDEVFDASTPWNSKKWRVLVHIDKSRNLVLFSRNYPYVSKELELELSKMIAEIYPDQGFNGVTEISKDEVSPYYGNGRGRVNYNDLNYVKNVNAVIGKEYGLGDLPDKIIIGHSATCCSCEVNDIEESCEFHCYSCSPNRVCCDSCGHSGFHEDEMHSINGESICDCCRDEYYTMCENCDDTIYNDDCHYLEETGCYYCEDCYEEIRLDFLEEDEEPEDDDEE